MDVEVVRAVDFVEAGEHGFLGSPDLEPQLAEAPTANDDFLDLAETGIHGGVFIDRRRCGLSLDVMSGDDRNEECKSAQGGALCHPPRAATRAEAAALTTEGDELVGATMLAAHRQKGVFEGIDPIAAQL